MSDFVIANGTVITLDFTRSLIRNGAVAITGRHIAAVGETDDILRRYPNHEIIDARNSVIMPGLVDLHAKVGHATFRSLGEHLSGEHFRLLWDEVALRAATERWYYVDAQLGAAERLLNGCTTFVTQAGAAQARMGDTRYVGQVHRALKDLGVRARIIAGIGRPPLAPDACGFCRWSESHA